MDFCSSPIEAAGAPPAMRVLRSSPAKLKRQLVELGEDGTMVDLAAQEKTQQQHDRRRAKKAEQKKNEDVVDIGGEATLPPAELNQEFAGDKPDGEQMEEDVVEMDDEAKLPAAEQKQELAGNKPDEEEKETRHVWTFQKIQLFVVNLYDSSFWADQTSPRDAFLAVLKTLREDNTTKALFKSVKERNAVTVLAALLADNEKTQDKKNTGTGQGDNDDDDNVSNEGPHPLTEVVRENVIIHESKWLRPGEKATEQEINDIEELENLLTEFGQLLRDNDPPIDPKDFKIPTVSKNPNSKEKAQHEKDLSAAGKNMMAAALGRSATIAAKPKTPAKGKGKTIGSPGLNSPAGRHAADTEMLREGLDTVKDLFKQHVKANTPAEPQEAPPLKDFILANASNEEAAIAAYTKLVDDGYENTQVISTLTVNTLVEDYGLKKGWAANLLYAVKKYVKKY